MSTRANLRDADANSDASPLRHMTCLICDGGLRLLACHGRPSATATHADGLENSADGGHVICQSCIETWFDAQKELHAKSDIVPLLRPTCPVCKCALRTGSTRGDASRFLGLPRIADAQTTSADPDGLKGSYSYQWQRSGDGESWSDISITTSTYTISGSDLGKQIRALISYTDSKDHNEKVTTTSLAIPVPVETFGSITLAKSDNGEGYAE